MVNLVEVTVRTTADSSGLAKAKADAAAAGKADGESYAKAFKVSSQKQTAQMALDLSKAAGQSDGGGLAGKDQALLKKLENQAAMPGGIGIIGTGTDSTLRNMIRNMLAKGDVGLTSGSPGGSGGKSGPAATPTTDPTDALLQQMMKQMLKEGVGGVGTGGQSSASLQNQTTTDKIVQQMVGKGASNQTTTDRIVQQLTGKGASDQTTTDKIVQQLVGKGPGNITTRDTIKEAIDPASASQAERDSSAVGDRAGRSFSSSFVAHIKGIFRSSSGPDVFGDPGGTVSACVAAIANAFRSHSKDLNAPASGMGKDFGKNLAGGIGPGIMGIGMKSASIVGAIGSLLATLPALAGIAGLGIGVALTGALVGEIAKSSPAIKAQFASLSGDAQKMMATVAKPLIPAFAAIVKQVGPMMGQIGTQLAGVMKTVAPQLMGIFNGLRPIISGVIGILQSAAPAFGPVIEALEHLVSNILPGIQVVIKAMMPFIQQFAGILSRFGSQIGGFFSAAAPAIAASMKVLSALLDVVGGLLPVIMKLAGVFATDLAPVFTQLAEVVKALVPFIMTLGRILAQLAGAILGDVVGALSSLAELLRGVAPSFNLLAKAAGNVFTILENSGVFASLGDALEAIVPSLSQFINLLAKQLAPVIPIIFGVVSQLATLFIGLFAAGLSTILGWLTKLMKALPWLVPAIAGITAVWWALNAAMAVNPFVAIGIAVVVLVGIVTKYHAQIWNVIYGTWKKISDFVSSVGDDIEKFVMGAWNTVLGFTKRYWPEIVTAVLGPVAGMVAFIIKYHTQIWDEIQKVWNAIENLTKSVWNAILSYLKGELNTIANAFTSSWNSIYNTIRSVWSSISGWFRNWWNSEVSGWRSIINTVENIFADCWNRIASTIRNDWNGIASFFSRILSDIKSGFSSSVDALRNTWNKLEGYFKGPVNFLINTVYNNGIRRLWNDIVPHIGGPSLPNVGGLQHGRVGQVSTIPGYGGGDRHLAMLEAGESVVPKELTPKMAGWLKSHGVPGHQFGWISSAVHDVSSVADTAWSGIKDAASIVSGLATGNTTALANDLNKFIGTNAKGDYLTTVMRDIPKDIIGDLAKWIAHFDLGGSGQEIVDYAASFMGKIPYVWGGTSLSYLGADCSGFTGSVYRHFGMNPPRTSEAQGAWVQRSGPQPGGLAFYHSPAGGADPGHVAIVKDANTAISQGGGMGPQLMGLHAMPLLWTGIPPGGFKGGTTGGAAGAAGTLQQQAQAMLNSRGWGGQWAAFDGLEMAEAGWNMTAQNPGSGAYGLAQFINGAGEYAQYGGNSTTGSGQLTAMMNYIADTYGDPNGAWAHELGYHWYGSGTSNAKPGWAMVGEHGRELVKMPGGAAVYPNSQTEKMLGGNVHVHFEVGGSGNSEFDKFMLNWVRNNVRVKGGGNVQTAFGRH